MSTRQIYSTIVSDHFPEEITITFGSGTDTQHLLYTKVRWDLDGTKAGLRYGENPDQEAALYRLANGNVTLGDVVSLGPESALTTSLELLRSGKHPGKINITDVDSALGILRYLHDRPACVIVKHNNPSGVALANSPLEAYQRALSGDRIAAFGGAIALNRELDHETAEAILSYYAEVVVAPEFAPGVIQQLGQRKNLRILRIRQIERLQEWTTQRFVDFKSLIDGGLIAQWSFVPLNLSELDPAPASVSKDGVEHRIARSPSEAERRDMRFGWFVESGVTSNSVLYVKDERTIAIGTGEQDRVGVARIARDKAFRNLADALCLRERSVGLEELVDEEERSHYLVEAQRLHGGLEGATMVSDAFFPFRDGAIVGLREGVRSIVQPGGAIRDWDVIDACNEYDATMVFTGQRSFRH